MTTIDENDSIFPSTLIADNFDGLIKNNQFDEALSYLTEKLTEKEIYEHTWDLATYFCQLAEKPSDKICNQFQLVAQDALIHLAKHGNPRELLIIIMEQSDQFVSDEVFLFHMNLYSILIPRLPVTASLKSSIKDVLGLLKCHFTTLELPPLSSDTAGKEMWIFHHDRRVVRLLDLLKVYVEFVCKIRDDLISKAKFDVLGEIRENLMDLIEESLTGLSFEPIEGEASPSLIGIRSLIDCLFSVAANPLKWLVEEENRPTLVYLLLTKEENFQRLPKVFSPNFFLFLSVAPIEFFVRNGGKVLFAEKATSLSSAVCSPLIEEKQFDETIFENETFEKLVENLKIFLVENPSRHFAATMKNAFLSLFKSIDRRSRAIFLHRQLKKTQPNEDSYRTFLCVLTKEQFQHDFHHENLSIYTGSFLFQMLDDFSRLPKSVESDLLEIYDCLSTSLNFIRFIALLDRRESNRTLFWTKILPKLDENLLKPLRKSIDLARAHYQLEMKNRTNDKTEIVLETQLGPMPTEQEKLQSLQMALTKFDVLDCILTSLNNALTDQV